MAVRLSLLRTRVTPKVLPGYYGALRMPTFGILRNGLEAFTLDKDRKPVTEDLPMRMALGIEPAPAVLSKLFSNASRGLKAYSGLGNHPLNSGCVIWSGGTLVHRIDEGARIAAGPPYFCIVLHKDATLSTQACQFAPRGTEHQWNIVIGGRDVSDDICWAISGPPLVRDGQPIDPYADLAAASVYPDLRHLICGPYPFLTDRGSGQPAVGAKGKRIGRDFCMDELAADPHKRAAAIGGDIVVLEPFMCDMEGREYTVTAEDLVKALEDKSYLPVSSLQELEECRRKGERGRYWLNPQDTVLHIIYRPSPYPHHFLALREDEPGVLYDFAIGGWSNNGGSDPATIAADLAAAGFSQAILLDNGADVLHVYVPSDSIGHVASYDPNGVFAVVPSSLGRERLAGFLAYTVDGGEQDSAIQNWVVVPQNQDSEHEELEIQM